MAVRTVDEIMESFKGVTGDDATDEMLNLMTDVRDTLSSRSSDMDWEQRYNENDAAWRKKYRDAFFSTPAQEPENPKKENKPLTFEGLFKKG